MGHFKKKSIALIVASFLTVASSVIADGYINTVKALKFEDTPQGTNLTISTQSSYSGTINLVKRDANTYVIMLPEISSEKGLSPTLTANINSVDIKTMPYTSSGKGYTKITVKTSSGVAITTNNTVYTPELKDDEKTPSDMSNNYNNMHIRNDEKRYSNTRDINDYSKQRNYDRNDRVNDTYSAQQQTAKIDKNIENKNLNNSIRKEVNSEPITNTEENYSNIENQKVNTEVGPKQAKAEDLIYFLGGLLLVITIVVFLYIKSKRKLSEMVGDQSDLDFSDDSKQNKKPTKSQLASSRKIRQTIAQLDRMYAKPANMSFSKVDENSQTVSDPSNETVEEDNIVDLDELFQQQKKEQEIINKDNTEEENEALDAFLSSFSFDEDSQKDNFDEQKINEGLYNKYINDETLKFTHDDVNKINALMKNEISESAVNDMLKEKTVPQPTKLSKKEILEQLMTTLTVKQNIVFSRDDVVALNKLISVELDNDFITDLRTNPKRVQKMRREIEERSVSASKKVNEILTLNVKDMLPDLSEALKKQGKRAIESEAKPEVIYYNEGYEYTTLSIKNELPDLHSEKNIKSNTYRPSDDVEYSVEGYDAPTLKIDDILPDLKDVKAHPKKYEEKKQSPVKVNEKELLKNINNVSFKPFYDGNEDFEIINKPEDFISEEDLHQEFEDFTNFEIINNDNLNNVNDNKEESIEIEENGFYDLDENIEEDQGVVEEIPDEDILRILEEEKGRNYQQCSSEKVVNETKTQEPISAPSVCVIENETFKIIKTQNFTDRMGCYLAKSDEGYAILGYVGNKIFKIKYYEKLSSENLQSRVSEKLPDGSLRYIVRIGLHKFILNVSQDDMEYVMDLC